MVRVILSSVLAAIVATVATTAARADFRVCNKANERVQVAFGYDAGGKRGWFSEGWWVLQAGECAVVRQGNLTNRFYYLYAEGERSDLIWDGGTDSDAARFCIERRRFLLNRNQHGSADDASCKRFGLESRNFFAVDTGDQLTWTQDLTLAAAPSPPPPVATPSPPKGPPPAGSACERFPNLC